MRLAAVAVAGLSALFAAVPAQAARTVRCPPRDSHIIVRTDAAAVFVNTTTGAYVGCLRPRSRARRIAFPDGVYSTVDAVVVAGRFVAYAFSHVPECKAHCPPEVTTTAYIGLVDLRSGRRHSADALGVSALVVTRTGTAVFLVGDELRALDGTGERVIDSGDIPARSVRRSGTTVTWTNGGAGRSQGFPAEHAHG